MPYAMLSKEGRRKRTYRSKLAALGVRRLLSPLIAAAAVLDHEEAARQEAECAKAMRQQRQRRLEQQLAERNPAANGPAAIMLRAAARVEGDDDCLLCCDNDALVQSMRCCGNACCAPCLGNWLRRNGEMYPIGYGDADFYVGVDEACQMRASDTYAGSHGRGREIRVRMNTHRCPWCDRPVESVRRGIV